MSSFLRLELVNACKDIAMVFTEKSAKMFYIFCMHFLLCQHTACTGKGLVGLVIQFLAIGYDNKCPVSKYFSMDFLGKEEHRDAFPAALCMPKDTEFASVIFNLFVRIAISPSCLNVRNSFSKNLTALALQSDCKFQTLTLSITAPP